MQKKNLMVLFGLVAIIVIGSTPFLNAASTNVYCWTGAGAAAQFSNKTSQGTTTINAIVQLIAPHLHINDELSWLSVLDFTASIDIILTAKYANGTTASLMTTVLAGIGVWDSSSAYITSRVFFNFGAAAAAWHTIILYFNFLPPTQTYMRQGAFWVPNGILVNVSPAIIRNGFCVLVIDNSMSLLSIGGPQGIFGGVGVLKVTLPF